jgi:DNA/RNA endonuclease YhcR with UshA esterase domain
MNDKTLLNISLIVAAIGIITLLLLSYYDKIPEKAFNEITSGDISSRITVKGVAKQLYPHNNSVSIKLEQTCTMDITSFEKNLSVNIGDNLSVQGAVQEYNGRMNILADKITKIK